MQAGLLDGGQLASAEKKSHHIPYHTLAAVARPSGDWWSCNWQQKGSQPGLWGPSPLVVKSPQSACLKFGSGRHHGLYF